jgi:hypothetical protein
VPLTNPPIQDPEIVPNRLDALELRQIAPTRWERILALPRLSYKCGLHGVLRSIEFSGMPLL